MKLVLEVELKGESKQGEDNEGTGEATPKFEAMVNPVLSLWQ